MSICKAVIIDLTFRLGEQTTLAKNSPKFASLRTTVPMSVVKQWKLKEGDKLDWSWDIHNGKMVLIIQKIIAEAHTTTSTKAKKKSKI